MDRIDNYIQANWTDGKKRAELLKQREIFFLKKNSSGNSIMQEINLAVETRRRPQDALSQRDWVEVGLKSMGFESVPLVGKMLPQKGINTSLPQWVRDLNHVPAAFIWGEKDAYVPAKEALDRTTKGVIDRMNKYRRIHPAADIEKVWQQSQYLPNSPYVIEAEIAGMPHIGVAMDTKSYAKDVMDILSRIYEEKTQGQESSSLPQAKLRLLY